MDTLLDGIALVVTDGRAAAAPTLLRATSAFSGADVPVDECLRWSPFATAAGKIRSRHELANALPSSESELALA